MTVTVRPPVEADAPRSGAVHVRAWQRAYRGTLPEVPEIRYRLALRTGR